MIRTLKIRLILVVLCGLILASAGLVAVINIRNMNSVEAQARETLQMLAENGGKRPARTPEKENLELSAGDKRGSTAGRESQRRFFGGEQMNAAGLSNYYTVKLDENGEVISWQSDRADLYTDEEIAALAAEVKARGTDSGRVDTQFYRVTEIDGEKRLIAVDARMEIRNARQVLRTTVLVALAEDAVLFLGAVLLIRRAVRPVDEAMEKQKQFVWDASHELKTPLAVISANAEALAAEAGESKALSYIQSEVKRTDQLIQHLLTLARMEKGGNVPKAKFDLGRAVEEVALPFESAVFEAGKTMELRIPEGIAYTGNEEMIKQLAVILLSNAEKYSDAGGKITVTLEARGEKRVLTVHNTGPAIPREAREKIFDRFYRVDSAHSRAVEGNGLGLAIARSIVDIHKGRIGVISEEGKGTAFTVTL